MHSRLSLAAMFLLVAACWTTSTRERDGRVPKLSKDAHVFVALPADGRDDLTSYAGSGAMTLDAVEAAFKRHVVRVDGAASVETQDAALDEARQLGCSLLVIPEILHWEDRQTELSLERDALELRLILVDATAGATLDLVTLGSKSQPVTLRSARPEDMLAHTIRDYVDSLF